MNMNISVKLALCTLIYITVVPLTWVQGITLKPLSINVLDNAFGGNAPNVTCKLYEQVSSEKNEKKYKLIATAVTNADGRITEFLSVENYKFGIYRLWFGIEDYYYYSHGVATFFPEVEITFENKDGTASHIPLTISPYSTGTYKGW